MPLFLLLLAVPGPAVQPRHDLASHLAIAAVYRSANHASALQEIRQWTPPEIAKGRAPRAQLRHHARV